MLSWKPCWVNIAHHRTGAEEQHAQSRVMLFPLPFPLNLNCSVPCFHFRSCVLISLAKTICPCPSKKRCRLPGLSLGPIFPPLSHRRILCSWRLWRKEDFSLPWQMFSSSGWRSLDANGTSGQALFESIAFFLSVFAQFGHYTKPWWTLIVLSIWNHG